jgi:hypothetical protein
LTICIQWARSDAQSAIIKEQEAEEKGSSIEGGREEEGEADAKPKPQESRKLYLDGEADSKLGTQLLPFWCCCDKLALFLLAQLAF